MTREWINNEINFWMNYPLKAEYMSCVLFASLNHFIIVNAITLWFHHFSRGFILKRECRTLPCGFCSSSLSFHSLIWTENACLVGKEAASLLQSLNKLGSPEEKVEMVLKKYTELVSIQTHERTPLSEQFFTAGNNSAWRTVKRKQIEHKPDWHGEKIKERLVWC